MMVEFKMWTPFHYFMIFFPFILAFAMYYTLKDKPYTIQRNVGISLALTMIAILIMRNTFVWIKHGSINPEVFPLQVCHFANFIFLAALLSKDRVWGTIGWCLNFPAGLVSVIFADGLERYDTMIDIQAFAYIAGHMLIVTMGLYLVLTGIIKIDWRSMAKMYPLVTLGYLLSVPVNSWFNRVFAHLDVPSNYFYSYLPEAGTPLETMFNLGNSYRFLGFNFNPLYLFLLAVVGIIILALMFGIYKAIEFFLKPKLTSQQPVSL